MRSRQLMSRALSAPPDVDRIEGDDGEHATIERHEDGITVTLFAADGTTIIRVARWPVAEDRPPGYPADLPFLPGIPCSVGESDGTRFVLWGAGSPEPEQLQASRALLLGDGDVDPQAFEGFAARLRELRGVTSDARRAAMTEAFEAMGIDESRVEALGEHMKAIPVDPDVEARYDRGFEDAIAQTEEGGWRRAEPGAVDSPARIATFRRDGVERSIIRWSLLGASQIILREQPAEA